MRMYDYSEQYVKLESLLSEGTIDQETYNDTIESLSEGANEKANNLGKMISNFTAQANMYKEEEKKLKEKRKSLENSIEWLTNSLHVFLQANNKDEMTVGLYKLGYRKLPDMVEVKNEKVIPTAYKERVVTIKPDKRAIKKAIEDGETVRGAELITNRKKFEVKML